MPNPSPINGRTAANWRLDNGTDTSYMLTNVPGDYGHGIGRTYIIDQQYVFYATYYYRANFTFNFNKYTYTTINKELSAQYNTQGVYNFPTIPTYEAIVTNDDANYWDYSRTMGIYSWTITGGVNATMRPKDSLQFYSTGNFIANANWVNGSFNTTFTLTDTSIGYHVWSSGNYRFSYGGYTEWPTCSICGNSLASTILSEKTVSRKLQLWIILL